MQLYVDPTSRIIKNKIGTPPPPPPPPPGQLDPSQRRIQSHARESVIKPPSYDPRDIVALVEKYGDAHISDSGWRVVDQEEWYEDN